MVASRHYDRPPITEAVIDVKFDANLTERERERLMERFKGRFPSVEERKTITVEFGPKEAAAKAAPAGYKMTAANALDLVLINDASFGTARLAPYDRWETFLASAKENFDIFSGVVGRKIIGRLGVRFINRIDIPRQKLETRAIDDLFRLNIALPGGMERERRAQSFAVDFTEATTGAKVLLRYGDATPALLDHLSFNLDIDAFWEGNVPTKIEEMWKSAEALRHAKNACFELSITDEIRELFQ
jgi:uncharacterized protein (TIGR04255 family)